MRGLLDFGQEGDEDQVHGGRAGDGLTDSYGGDWEQAGPAEGEKDREPGLLFKIG